MNESLLSPQFKVSLRLVHPSMPSPEISQGFEVDSKWGWSVGEERRSPAGDLPTGRLRTSYWAADLSSGGDDLLVDLLAVCLDWLKEKRSFPLAFYGTGGRTGFFLGRFVRGLQGVRAQFMSRCRVSVGVQELNHEVWGDTIDDSCAGLSSGTKLAGDCAAFRGPCSDFSYGSTGF